MTQPLLSLRGISVVRGRSEILSVPGIDVFRGEVLTVIGPNGAGKSTLLQVMALLETPRRGRVLIDGREPRGSLLPYRRRMALVFQEPLLLDTTVEANAAAGLDLRGVGRKEKRERASRWLEAFGVTHLAGRSARTLSGGEAQRVSLARAMAIEPELLLLDEPFAALDAPTRQALIDDLARVLESRDIATVFVTHDRTEALRLGDTMAVLIGGRVRQSGLPPEIFAAPADQEVAAFVGVENIIAGRVQSVEDGLARVSAAGHQIEAGAEAPAGESVLVCVRPEDVVLTVDPAALASSARNRVGGTVARVLPSGPFVRVEIDAGVPLVALITRQSLEEMSLGPGSQVTAAFKATAVHLIPRHSTPDG